MNLRTQLLAIHLTKGIGIQTKTSLIKKIENNLVPKQYPWTLNTVLGFSDSRFYGVIQNSYGEALQLAKSSTADFITYFDHQFPMRLREIYQPPLILFYKGNLKALKLPSLSVVGTRMPSSYGFQSLKYLIPPIVHQGVAIVSGLAKGIDEMSHQVTLNENGVPIAIIGTGIDTVYPRNHVTIQHNIGETGLILSEYPNGTGPRRSHFPERNRIIAGLSSATLVIESKKKSGSLITANVALQNNREVLAIPGNIFSKTSEGTNDLISVGAKVVTKPTEIMESVQLLDTI
ncbi:DNA-processing protein DprA [Leuconostoc palmae]|uniref:DNA-processing protein DprA n=1 Tax=Leuconostoc palmae TaxID=501487 RepID=UPI001C7DA9FF|nr:DNA-processing protein DprA [Leuconostoc palmae]